MKTFRDSSDDEKRYDAVEAAAMRLLLIFYAALAIAAIAGLWILTN